MDTLILSYDENGSPSASGTRMEGLMRTPCHHIYHEKCLKEWMNKKLECPNCRKILPELDDEESD